jgi:hypothetical protein
MRPEGSCRKVGVIYSEVALPSIKMDNMGPPRRYAIAREAARRLASSQALLWRVAARLVERWRVDVQRWIKPVDSIRPQLDLCAPPLWIDQPAPGTNHL